MTIEKGADMLAKAISVFLALTMLLYLGCHDSQRLTRDEFALARPIDEIRVLTRDGARYDFEAKAYELVGDSLTGGGVQVVSTGKTRVFKGSIALSDIVLVEKEELNGPKTILCVLGVSAAAAMVLTAIAMAEFTNDLHTASERSCPFVYTYDGTNYHFESETFAGAVLKGLERTSYDNLRYLKPVNGVFHLKLSNEREETEYVNELKLIVVDHPQSVKIIPDMIGALRTLAHPQMPLSCVDFSNHDALGTITASDGRYWESDLSTATTEAIGALRDGIILEFAKPEDASVAKLVVNGVNTGLGEFAFRKLFQLQGDNKLNWYQELEEDSSARASFKSFLMREGMLHLSVWQDGGWREQHPLPDVGPLIAKDQIALLDVRNVAGTTLKVKLDCTPGLWRIDQVSVDYSPDSPVIMTELSPDAAVDERRNDVRNLLAAADDHYFVTVTGQHAELAFSDIPLRPGLSRSYVLKTRGFYYQWIDSHGPPNDTLLARVLGEPGFAARRYLPEWMRVNAGLSRHRN